MEHNFALALLDNATLLLLLSVIYEVTYLMPSRYNRFRSAVNGSLIALTCIAIMMLPFSLQPGLVFDTRSILISITALIFGLVPTVITVAAASIFRLIMGGVGTLPGLAVIFTSALIGLAWRRWLYPKFPTWRCLNTYLMSIVVHLVMLVCMFLLPYPDNLAVIVKIAWPVMIIYPIVSMLLSIVLIRQKNLRSIQDQLSQSEERFQLLFNKAPLGYQSLDDKGYLIDVNQQWLDTFGYSREEVIGRWFGDFLSPASKELFLPGFLIFKSHGQIHSEFEMLHKSGNALFISFEGKIAYGLDGKFIQTHCILQDITEQKRNEEALLNSEMRYRRLFESAQDGILILDAETAKIIDVNPYMLEMLGCKNNQLIEKQIWEIEAFKRIIKSPEHFLELINKGKIYCESLPLNTVKGEKLLVEFAGNVYFSDKQKVIQFNLRNITACKRAEKALFESERKYTSYIENAPNGIIITNKNGLFIEVNNTVSLISGYTKEELLQMTFSDITSEESQASNMHHFNELIKSGSNSTVLQYTHKNGSKRWLTINAVKLSDDRFLFFC